MIVPQAPDGPARGSDGTRTRRDLGRRSQSPDRHYRRNTTGPCPLLAAIARATALDWGQHRWDYAHTHAAAERSRGVPPAG